MKEIDEERISSVPEVGEPEQSETGGETLRLVHHHAGYLRIQADAFVNQPDSSVLKAAKKVAESVPGFLSWNYNPKTGSVVVKYDPAELDADDFLKHIAKHASLGEIEQSSNSKRSRQELVGAFLDTVQGIDRVVAQMTHEKADLRELVPIALVATSVVSFIVNDPQSRLPNWFSSLYRSYRVFMHWHRTEVRSRERVSRKRDESEKPGRKVGYA